MAYNKIITKDGRVLIDLTQDTITPETLAVGITAHAKNGEVIVGEMTAGDPSIEDGLINKTLTTYTNDRLTTLGPSAFATYSKLTTVNFPVCTSIGSSAFCSCNSLTSVNFPKCAYIGNVAFATCSKLTSISFPTCTRIGDYAFQNCNGLTTVSFPACTSIGSLAFAYCSSLTTVIFPACTNIGSSAFFSCFSLTTAYFLASSLCTLNSTGVFYRTRITSSTGSIFVPASLVAAYKSATNWTYFSNRIFAAD